MTLRSWGPPKLALVVDVNENDDAYGPEIMYTTDPKRRFACGPTQQRAPVGIIGVTFLEWFHPDAFEFRKSDTVRTSWRCQWCRLTFAWDPR